MQQNIWSSPQVGGSGGALKALARNVANHLKLNRSAMKRVVAQVVAEHHSLGEVADYKGHMYFAKPDRLNFTELIAQSKEAFDDLLLHEPRLANRIQSRPMGNPKPKFQPVKSPPRQRAAVKPVPSRILKMPSKPQLPISKISPPARKQRVPSPKKKRSRSALKQHHPSTKKSSTTEFQLDDAGTVRSLNGVIIEDNHLPQEGENREILLHVPQAAKKPRHRAPRTIKLHEAQEVPKKAPSVVAAPKPAVPRPAPAPPGSNQGSARRVLSRRSQRQLNAAGRRLVAGGAPSPLPKSGSAPQKQPAPGKKPLIKKNFKAPRYNKKQLPLLQRTYEKPWLVRRRKKRLSGGCQKPVPGKAEATTSNVAEKASEALDKVNVEWVEKNSDKDEKSDQSVKIKIKEEPKIHQPPPARRQQQSHVARQMRNVSFPWYTPYQFQGGTDTPGRAIMEAGLSNHRLSLQRSRRNMPGTPIPSLKRKLNITKRQRHHRRMQEQLLRELQREEAIDEPQSNGSGVFRQRRVWQQPDPQDQPKGGPKNTPTKSKTASPDRRSLERVSSRVKRFRQPAASGARTSPVRAAGGGLGRARGASSAGSPRRRRNRYVPVGSSLGSIAALAADQPQNSKQSLTPAKRHLTIAFMNKRDERSHHRQPQQHWK
ncbi:uncharacterized protein [Drosophila bipectinata]|uniref:uncharacterized protein n=1 Tax=Drosophila bipectinata TaxID=42026 RepID=UPI001C8AC363|nr:uncharacterized protein LOC108121657 [Drosophila bipectinata]